MVPGIDAIFAAVTERHTRAARQKQLASSGMAKIEAALRKDAEAG